VPIATPTGSSRPSKRFTVGDGIVIELEAPPPRLAFRANAKILGAFGPTLSGLLSGAGLKVSDTETLTWAALFSDPASAFVVLNAVAAKLAAVNVDLVADLVDELVVGRCTIAVGGGQPVMVTSVDVLDMFLPDAFAMAAVARYALELALRPTGPAGGGNRRPG
jgi:hypothetical protein